MKMIALMLLLQSAPDGTRYEDPKKEIQWARTLEGAQREAKLRNVPIFIYLTSDA